MIFIDTKKNLESYINDYDGLICLLFIDFKKPPCVAMLSLLKDTFRYTNRRLLVVDVNEDSLADIMLEYSIGVLPTYLFSISGCHQLLR